LLGNRKNFLVIHFFRKRATNVLFMILSGSLLPWVLIAATYCLWKTRGSIIYYFSYGPQITLGEFFWFTSLFLCNYLETQASYYYLGTTLVSVPFLYTVVVFLPFWMMCGVMCGLTGRTLRRRVLCLSSGVASLLCFSYGVGGIVPDAFLLALGLAVSLFVIILV